MCLKIEYLKVYCVQKHFYLFNMGKTGQLHKKMLHAQNMAFEAEYEYIKHIRSTKIQEFQNETKDLIINKYNMYYCCYFGYQNSDIQIEPIFLRDDKSVSELYKRLALICHPDKCIHKWGEKIFKIINDAQSKNDIHTLENLWNYWEEHESFELYKPNNNKNKKDELEFWKREFWYLWFISNDQMFKKLFIDKETFIKIEELSIENEKLKKENAQLMAEKLSILSEAN